jgi:hypothetical protein
LGEWYAILLVICLKFSIFHLKLIYIVYKIDLFYKPVWGKTSGVLKHSK